MKKIINLLLISFFCIACTQKGKSIEEKLRDDSYKYWLAYKYYPSSEIDTVFSSEEHIYMSYFDINGKFLLFYKQNLLSEVEKDINNPISDIVNSNTWHLDNDSTLIINGASFQIKKLEDDMMIIYSPYSKNYALYIAASESLIPQEYRTLQ